MQNQKKLIILLGFLVAILFGAVIFLFVSMRNLQSDPYVFDNKEVEDNLDISGY